jgi:ferredoxin
MARELDATRVHDTLARQPQHPRWQLTASRCLSCGSCTMVCPTCFCTTLQDRTDFPGNVATRRRIWDSCFSLDFSYLHGGHVRSSPAARYRHWLTHKLSGWQDQFGTLGCVGCGRCITWCPAGIDLTEEVAALQALPRESSAHRPEVPHGRH